MLKNKKKIKVALLVDEYFGGFETAFGGYGFLARKYITKYMSNDEIQIDVLINRKGNILSTKSEIIDGVMLYKLPKSNFISKKWLNKQNYNIYLSIELTIPSFKILRLDPLKQRKLLLWIQDPRPWSDWREINTVKLFPESCYWHTQTYEFVHSLYKKNKVKFLSQAYCLNDKAKDLYRLDDDVPIQYLPNPVEIDSEFDVDLYPKKNNIIFLGRIESVKRGWLFCEIAKALPQYQFYVLGQTFREKEKNTCLLSKYHNISNLHFVGHVDGEAKIKYIKDAKILVNTSIHEALPISFLEVLAYGTLIVSCRNPENLVSNFGNYVGSVMGDGFDKIDLFIKAINTLIDNDEQRQLLARKAIEYVKDVHNIPKFISDLRTVIFEECSDN